MTPPPSYLADLLDHWIQGVVLLGLTVWSGAATLLGVVSEADWSKVFGPNGVAFVSSIATLTLWATGVLVVRQLRLDSLAKEKREAAERMEMEERLRLDRKSHFDDLKESNKMVVERLIEITTANHQVMLASSKTDMRVAESIRSLETQIQHLANSLPQPH